MEYNKEQRNKSFYNCSQANKHENPFKFCAICNLDSLHSKKRDWSTCSRCAKCYHNSCTGLTKKISSVLPSWVCPLCGDPNTTAVKRPIPTTLSITEIPITEDVSGIREMMDFLRSFNIIQRIPKGARASAALSLGNTIQKILDNNTISNWEHLFAFSYCLRRPDKSDSTTLTSKLKSQIKDFDAWVSSSPSTPLLNDFCRPAYKSVHNSVPSFPKAEYLKKQISSKIEKFDIKGAARIASSSDFLVPITDEILSTLRALHPERKEPLDNTSDDVLSSQPKESYHFQSQEVLKSIRSFPPGSASGPDKLFPDHLKDLTGSSVANSSLLLDKLTKLVNLIISGSVPPAIKPFLFGANLIAIKKSSGGVRPIAIGNTIRRLCSKLCSRKALSELIPLLFPLQLGCGTPKGAEGIVHASRDFIEKRKGDVFMKIDFKNAFNNVDRNAFLDQVRVHAPGLWKYAQSAYGDRSHLFASMPTGGSVIIPSAVGVQQGDPLGPVLFSVALHPLAMKLICPFNAWYLDDGSLGGSLDATLSDWHTISTEGPALGLHINPRKSEIFINPDLSSERRDRIASDLLNVSPDLCFVDQKNLSVLGAPLTKEACGPLLLEKLIELKRLNSNLKTLEAHDAFFLLKNCFYIPKLTHILRSGECYSCAILEEFDLEIRRSLEDILNTHLHDSAWIQASLPSCLGGLGIRSVSEVALPAFISSLHASEALVKSLSPSSESTIISPAMERALCMWKPRELPQPPELGRQKAWDMILCTKKANNLLNAATDMKERARLLASRAPHANDWIEAVPVSHLGLRMDNTQLRIVASLQIGTQICHHHPCACGSTMDRLGHHGLVCKFNAGRFSRHCEANDLIRRALQSASIPSLLEPTGLDRNDGKKPDGVTLGPWEGGKPAVWDFTCHDTLAPSHLHKSAVSMNAVAIEAEEEKRGKYSNLSAHYKFFPVACETLGGWSPAASTFIKTLGSRLTLSTGDARSTAFLWQRLSVAVKRGNAASVLSCFPRGREMDELFLL